MEKKFTPGPWKVQEKQGRKCRVRIWNDYIVADEVDKSDAALIAAAPDMFDALESISKAYQEMFDVMPVAWQTFDDIVQTALNKARGL